MERRSHHINAGGLWQVTVSGWSEFAGCAATGGAYVADHDEPLCFAGYRAVEAVARAILTVAKEARSFSDLWCWYWLLGKGVMLEGLLSKPK